MRLNSIRTVACINRFTKVAVLKVSFSAFLNNKVEVFWKYVTKEK